MVGTKYNGQICCTSRIGRRSGKLRIYVCPDHQRQKEDTPFTFAWQTFILRVGASVLIQKVCDLAIFWCFPSLKCGKPSEVNDSGSLAKLMKSWKWFALNGICSRCYLDKNKNTMHGIWEWMLDGSESITESKLGTLTPGVVGGRVFKV